MIVIGTFLGLAFTSCTETEMERHKAIQADTTSDTMRVKGMNK